MCERRRGEKSPLNKKKWLTEIQQRRGETESEVVDKQQHCSACTVEHREREKLARLGSGRGQKKVDNSRFVRHGLFSPARREITMLELVQQDSVSHQRIAKMKLQAVAVSKLNFQARHKNGEIQLQRNIGIAWVSATIARTSTAGLCEEKGEREEKRSRRDPMFSQDLNNELQTVFPPKMCLPRCRALCLSDMHLILSCHSPARLG